MLNLTKLKMVAKKGIFSAAQKIRIIYILNIRLERWYPPQTPSPKTPLPKKTLVKKMTPDQTPLVFFCRIPNPPLVISLRLPKLIPYFCVIAHMWLLSSDK